MSVCKLKVIEYCECARKIKKFNDYFILGRILWATKVPIQNKGRFWHEKQKKVMFFVVLGHMNCMSIPLTNAFIGLISLLTLSQPLITYTSARTHDSLSLNWDRCFINLQFLSHSFFVLSAFFSVVVVFLHKFITQTSNGLFSSLSLSRSSCFKVFFFCSRSILMHVDFHCVTFLKYRLANEEQHTQNKAEFKKRK